ncbi:hypothetical protein FQ087_15845 [Sporosarcina sp. ANT_H38]|uniref:DUF6612 family protein n=1 Tax=Sporosarcina sp. ANT_H38 TaxID=2597358 RepID=UPI0011F1DCD0|nr:DUF6612 family protein [Sporosarcina sp. ANT_H38]KAA0948482.1 hypothetical protein FQ087_15845 [Sporosarcina sp. ANT_H38]
MKNWMKGIATGILVLGLGACNTTAETKTDPDTGKKVEIENKSKMTAQEVYEKAMAVSEEQTSMNAKMDIDQHIKVPSQEFEMNNTIKMDMDMVMEPLSIYQKMNIDMGEQGKMNMEIYMTDTGFFVNEPESGEWIKLPNEMYETMIGQMGGGANPTLDMNMFKEFADDFKFEQTEDAYILKLSASGDKFSELFKKVATENMPAGVEMNEEQAEVMKNMEVKLLEYEIFIDKKTFYTNAFNMRMDMTMKVEGEEMHIDQKVNANISKINEIDKIEVPQEILDNAVDINESMGQ